MVGSLERCHKEIRSRSGTAVFETVFATEPEPVVGSEVLKVRYLSVTGANPTRLPEGVYVQTNIALDTFNADSTLSILILKHVQVALSDKTPHFETNSEPAKPASDYANSITFRPYFRTRTGALIIELSPAHQPEVDRLIHRVESGQVSMKFVPAPKP